MTALTTAILLCAVAATLGAFALAEPVPPVDLSALNPAGFTDEELDIPYHLQHFARVANSVVLDGPDRGFIGLSVWRRPQDNKPYNARVMENHLSLAFFYCTDRPWNPYYRSPQVRERLEAVLDFWCRMQNSDGRFSEYKDKGWNLPATAFATKFMGRTLELLAAGPPIDPGLLQRVTEADLKAIRATLTMDSLYGSGKTFSNQFTNVFAGAPAYLGLHPDPEIRELLYSKMRSSLTDYQSPAGYFYEANGPDFGYSLSTHHSNLDMSWNFLHDTPAAEYLVQMETRWAEWLSYNALREPDGSVFILNRGVETRQRHGDFDRLDTPIAEKVPLTRAFATSEAELAALRAKERAALVANWPRVRDLAVGNSGAFSPYAFLARTYRKWYPTQEQRAEATKLLPYLARDRFTHQRVDDRRPIVFTYIRRPGYYACLNTGAVITSQQRLGLGAIWLPGEGTVLQSQSASADSAWGTLLPDGKGVCEAASMPATFTVDGKDVKPETGNRDLAAGDVVAAYALGKTGRKSITFGDAAISVSVQRPGALTEIIPLLVAPTENLAISDHGFRLSGPAASLTVDCPDARLSTRHTSTTVGGRSLVVVVLEGKDRLEYRFTPTGAG